MTFIEEFNPCPCPFEGRPSNHLNNKPDRFLSLRKNVGFRWKGMGRLINGSQSVFCRFCLLMYRTQRKFIGSHDRVSGNRTCLRHGLIQGLKRCPQDSLSLLSSSSLGVSSEQHPLLAGAWLQYLQPPSLILVQQ